MVMLPPYTPNIIKEYIDENIQTQIAGFDLTVNKILKTDEVGVLDFDNSKRKIPKHIEIATIDGKWILEQGGYIVRYNEEVNVPLDSIGIVLPRSSLMRCGSTLFSAVWDPGYKGKGMGLLYVTNQLILYKNARIGQILFVRTSKPVKKGYSGKFQNEGINE